jgi:hypothetical protein
VYATSIYFISVQISSILYKLSPKVAALKLKLEAFVKDHCHPAENEYEKNILNIASGKTVGQWTQFLPLLIVLKQKQNARDYGMMSYITRRTKITSALHS